MICGNPHLTKVTDPDDMYTLGWYKTKWSWWVYYHFLNAFAIEQRAFPTVQYRYLFEETNGHTSGLEEINFNNSTTWPVQMAGREQAKKVIEDGPNGSPLAKMQEFLNQEHDEPFGSPKHINAFQTFMADALI